MTKNLGISAFPKSCITESMVPGAILYYSTAVDINIGIEGKPVLLIEKVKKRTVSLFCSKNTQSYKICIPGAANIPSKGL